MTKIALDKTDRKILSILQEDGRLSNQDVAEQVSLSPSPCLRRIKRLEEEGVIRQYVALLDPDKIGLGLLAYVNVRLEKHSDAAAVAHSTARALGALPGTVSPREDFAVAVGGWPEVVACYAMTGEMDLPAARARGRHGPLFALHDGDPAAPPGRAGREVELCAAAHQGYDGAAAGLMADRGTPPTAHGAVGHPMRSRCYSWRYPCSYSWSGFLRLGSNSHSLAARRTFAFRA
jgi:Lrp/AsnC family leucine-responsive transcriptional regulator